MSGPFAVVAVCLQWTNQSNIVPFSLHDLERHPGLLGLADRLALTLETVIDGDLQRFT
jgi:hypothetical protein